MQSASEMLAEPGRFERANEMMAEILNALPPGA
jgi:hypothetical protein